MWGWEAALKHLPEVCHGQSDLSSLAMGVEISCIPMGYGASVHIVLHCRRSLPERWTDERALWVYLAFKEAGGRVMGQANVWRGSLIFVLDIREVGGKSTGEASAGKRPCRGQEGFGKASDSWSQKDHANGHFCLQ